MRTFDTQHLKLITRDRLLQRSSTVITATVIIPRPYGGGALSDDARLTTSVVCLTPVAYIVNIHGAHSPWKQGALSAAGVRDGLQLGRSVRRTAGGGILCRHAHSLLLF